MVVAANPPAVEWMRTYPMGVRSEGCWVAQTPDRGFLVGGTWRPDNESFDFCLLKTDSLGDLQWSRALNVGPVAWMYSGGLTADGGSYSIGTQQDPSRSWALLVRTDAAGETLWSRRHERDSLFTEMSGFSAQPTADGGFVVGAYNGFEGAYLIKTDSAGNKQWHRVFRDGYRLSYYPTLLPVRQTGDHGYIIGTVRDTVLRLIKTDSLGQLLWERHYPGLGVREGMSLEPTRDGGYAVTGVGAATDDSADLGDVYLLKTDSAGEPEWKRTFGGPRADNGFFVCQLRDIGYAIAGITDHSGSEYRQDGYVARTDSLGQVLWDKSIGVPEAGEDARWVQQTADGGFVVTGWTGLSRTSQGSLYLLKFAPEQSR